MLSVTGLRHNNEDCCVARRISKNVFFFAVADGMGGKAGGEIASRIVLDAVCEYLTDEFGRENAEEKVKEIMAKSFLVAQTAVADYITSFPDLRGMGTTMAAVLVCNQKFVCGNIGDSRIYLFSDRSVSQITEDHTYIQDFKSKQNEPLPKAVIQRYQNVVTRIIDGGFDKPDIFPMERGFYEFKGGDVLLLCSDGLIVDKMCDYTFFLKETLGKSHSLKRTARYLVEWALTNGSEDNISVVLGSYGSANGESTENENQETIRILPKEMKKE